MSGSVSSILTPRFPDGILADAQSGNLSEIRIAQSGQSVTGMSLDLGRFTYNLTDPIHPQQIIQSALPIDFWDKLVSFEFVQNMINSKIDLHRTYDGKSLFNETITAGNIAAIALLIKSDSDTNSWHHELSYIDRAIASNRLDVVYLIINTVIQTFYPDRLIERYGETNTGVTAYLDHLNNPPRQRLSEQQTAITSSEWNTLGITHHRQGNYIESLESFQNASIADPDSARGFFNQACALSLLERRDEAVARLAWAAVLDKGWVKQNLGDSDLISIRHTIGFQQIVEAINSL